MGNPVLIIVALTLVFSIAGAFDDVVEGNEGADLVFGDHGEIKLSEDTPYKLVYATSIDAACTPGIDNITLGDGDDIAFGGKCCPVVSLSCFGLIDTIAD